MGLLHQLFSVDDLKELDAKELDILRSAIRDEIIHSQEIRNVLRRRAHQVYSQLKPGTTPRGPTGPEEPRPRPPRRRR